MPRAAAQLQPAPGRKRVTLERSYDAPVARLWKAWTDAKQWGAWFSEGPAQVDLRVGGRYSTPDQDTGEYREVVKHERLSFTWEHPHHVVSSPGSVVTLAFNELEPDRSKLRLTHSGLSEKDAADLKEGWSWALASLDNYLRTRKPLKQAEWEAQRKTGGTRTTTPAPAPKPVPARPAAGSSGNSGGAMRWELLLKAPPDKVWRALTADIDNWWTQGFSDVAPVVLEARLGGRFYEAFDDVGNGVLFATVTHCQPPKLLRYIGTLGMQPPVMSQVSYELEPEDNGTRVRCVIETLGQPNAKVPNPNRTSWQGLLENLRVWVEDGQRAVLAETK
jgi:uncharacterized protein YndB with AHSA1/START domain